MRTLRIKQLEHDSLIDYMKRFKQSRDVLKSHIGGDILNKFVENQPEYRHVGENTLPQTEHVSGTRQNAHVSTSRSGFKRIWSFKSRITFERQSMFISE